MTSAWKKFFSGPWPLVIILAAAALLRLAATVENAHSPLFSALRLDEAEYDDWAQEVAAGYWFREFVPNHGPGYPWLLGVIYLVFGRHLLLPRLLQVGLGLGATWLGFLIGQRLWGRTEALISATLLGLYWPLIIFEQRLLAVTWFLFLDLLFLLLSLKAADKNSPRAWIAPGLALGLSALVWPTSLCWLAALLVWFLVRAVRAKSWSPVWAGLIIFAATMVPLGPVLLKNHALSGRWSLIQMDSAMNLFLGNNPESDGTPYARYGGTWDRIESLPVKEAGLEDLGAQEDWFVNQVGQFLVHDPRGFGKLLLLKTGLLLNHREIRATIDPEFQRTLFTALKLPLPGFALILALALPGILALSRKKNSHQVLAIFILAYGAAVVLTVVSSRYRVPFSAGLALLAGPGVMQLVGALKKKIALSLIALMIAFLPLGPRYTAAEEWTYLGDAWLDKNDPASALTCYQKALALDARHPDGLMGMARLEEGQGRLDSALEWQKKAVAADPGSASAHLELGRLYLKKGALKHAYSEFNLSAACRPQWLPALQTLALFEAENGLYDQAIAHLEYILRLFPNLSEFRTALAKVQAARANSASPGGGPP